jgi:homoserine O-acetyltransferase
MQQIQIKNIKTHNGSYYDSIPLSYEVFGKKLGSAPVVLINHALTGNSSVAGEKGWWASLVGDGKAIDTNRYSVLAFNVPGNGYDGFVIEDYQDFIASDMAHIFLLGLELLEVRQLYALVGGSLGGGIAWEMLKIKPNLSLNFIPIATDWKSTDWLIANCKIQENILLNSSNPIQDARIHAMLCYRTPESFASKFGRSKTKDASQFQVESWLNYHGEQLNSRFELAAYKLMNQLLRSIDIEHGAKEDFRWSVFDKITAKTTIIAVDSDLFFTAKENKNTYQELLSIGKAVSYFEIQSIHGHDAFLIEYKQLEEILKPIFKPKQKSQTLKIVKFGGKSLANGQGISQVLKIVENLYAENKELALVLSARGDSTDSLLQLLEEAKSETWDIRRLEEFLKDQQIEGYFCDLEDEETYLRKVFQGIALLKDFSSKIKDEVLSYGERISVKVVSNALREQGVPALEVDTRDLLITDDQFGQAEVNENLSSKNFAEFYKQNKDQLCVFTGFIGGSLAGLTTTLGRNGSNYSSSLIANYLNASELISYTHVDGIYSANPAWVKGAIQLRNLSYEEANEMANFGASILHAKTIIPLVEKQIPLRIKNTFNPEDEGTLIDAKGSGTGIKSLSIQENMTLIHLEGRGLLGKVGVDARIFGAMGRAGVSVGIISQGSSERGIGFVVGHEDALRAKKALEEEFQNDFRSKDVEAVFVRDGVAVLSIIGQDLNNFHKSLAALGRNAIEPVLINNAITGKNICLVLDKADLLKSVNIIHAQVFGAYKTINIALIGKGLVGGTLIQQILDAREDILERRSVKLNVFAVANSKSVLLDENGINSDWEEILLALPENKDSIESIIKFAQAQNLENLIAVDNTASSEFVQNYPRLIEAGFDLVSSNKIANTIGLDYYDELRTLLKKHKKRYLYETNVGAGLPLIDTIKLLHHTGENITRIKGVFSGSLSFLFNNYSIEDVGFSNKLKEAIEKGYTEPDPREDLCGNDVARKLLILARELDLKNEFEDIEIENLIPEPLRPLDVETFLGSLDKMDQPFQHIKSSQEPGHVLRYIGDLYGDLSSEKGKMKVSLVSVPENSSLGGVKGSDSIFEIYTESYGDHPIVIQGAGAGAEVTARGVLGDILRLTENAN